MLSHLPQIGEINKSPELPDRKLRGTNSTRRRRSTTSAASNATRTASRGDPERRSRALNALYHPTLRPAGLTSRRRGRTTDVEVMTPSATLLRAPKNRMRKYAARRSISASCRSRRRARPIALRIACVLTGRSFGATRRRAEDESVTRYGGDVDQMPTAIDTRKRADAVRKDPDPFKPVSNDAGRTCFC